MPCGPSLGRWAIPYLRERCRGRSVSGSFVHRTDTAPNCWTASPGLGQDRASPGTRISSAETLSSADLAERTKYRRSGSCDLGDAHGCLRPCGRSFYEMPAARGFGAACRSKALSRCEIKQKGAARCIALNRAVDSFADLCSQSSALF